jgi:hypothetical protein
MIILDLGGAVRVGKPIKTVMMVAALALVCFSAKAAPTAELAKKCQRLAVKAHARSLPGTKGGSAQAERAYFAECIRRGGNMDQESPEGK